MLPFLPEWDSAIGVQMPLAAQSLAIPEEPVSGGTLARALPRVP